MHKHKHGVACEAVAITFLLQVPDGLANPGQVADVDAILVRPHQTGSANLDHLCSQTAYATAMLRPLFATCH